MPKFELHETSTIEVRLDGREVGSLLKVPDEPTWEVWVKTHGSIFGKLLGKAKTKGQGLEMLAQRLGVRDALA